MRASPKVCIRLARDGIVLRDAARLGACRLERGVQAEPFPAAVFHQGPWASAHFDPETLSYAGTPVEQAMCLMRGMDATRNLGPPLAGLPPGLANRIGQSAGLPSREALGDYLPSKTSKDFAAHLWQPVSRAHDNDPDAPAGTLFRDSRYQRTELRTSRVSRRHRYQSRNRKPRRFCLFRRLGSRACLHQSHRRRC